MALVRTMENETIRRQLFQAYPVLRLIAAPLLHSILEQAPLMELPVGAVVFQPRQACLAFPFILGGEIRVYKQADNGRELSLYSVGRGGVCVVSAGCILGNRAYDAAGQVVSACRLLGLGHSAFERLLDQPPFRQFVLNALSERLLGLMQLVEAVAFHRLDRRLATLLLQPRAPGPISHQRLADELGSVREIVTRLLNQFAAAGWIKLGRGRVQLLRPEPLRALAQGDEPLR